MKKSLLFLSLTLAVCAPLGAFAADAGAGQSVVERYVDLLYRQKKVDEAMALIAQDLVQHSPRVKDGRDAWASEMRFITQDPTSSFDVQEVLVQGDKAAVHFFGHLKADAPAAEIFEIYRVKSGLIVEHWSAFQMQVH